ncbi:hypothetical protein C8R47DRAFT_1074286 [Mycena vitilis]|nr:hypothetical protein C8R47DRAFT_1074286 [Mycena vitilis]
MSLCVTELHASKVFRDFSCSSCSSCPADKSPWILVITPFNYIDSRIMGTRRYAVQFRPRALSLDEQNAFHEFHLYTAWNKFVSTCAWLDDPAAPNTLKAALIAYLPKSSTNQDPKLCSRVQEIITNLDALHPQRADWVQARMIDAV